MVSFGIRAARVFIETLFVIWYLAPLYEELRKKHLDLNLPESNSLPAVFGLTLLTDLLIFQD